MVHFKTPDFAEYLHMRRALFLFWRHGMHRPIVDGRHPRVVSHNCFSLFHNLCQCMWDTKTLSIHQVVMVPYTCAQRYVPYAERSKEWLHTRVNRQLLQQLASFQPCNNWWFTYSKWIWYKIYFGYALCMFYKTHPHLCGDKTSIPQSTQRIGALGEKNNLWVKVCKWFSVQAHEQWVLTMCFAWKPHYELTLVWMLNSRESLVELFEICVVGPVV